MKKLLSLFLVCGSFVSPVFGSQHHEDRSPVQASVKIPASTPVQVSVSTPSQTSNHGQVSVETPNSDSKREISHLGKIKIVVSVDWEGIDLRAKNLNEFKKFREDFPNVPLLHFLNAAYYTKPDADAEQITEKIQSVLLPSDELGLHIHGWKSLFEAAGVTFRSGPSVFGKNLDDCTDDCGYEVGISAYSESELRQVIRYSIQVLSKNGFGQAKSFRAGYWQGSDHLFSALSAEGITLDSSSVPFEFFNSENAPVLHSQLKDVWGSLSPTGQPFQKQTPSGSIWEVPDNACLADCGASDKMIGVFERLVELYRSDSNRNLIFQVGFHQESAADQLHKIRRVLNEVEAYASRNSIPIEYATLPLVNQCEDSSEASPATLAGAEAGAEALSSGVKSASTGVDSTSTHEENDAAKKDETPPRRRTVIRNMWGEEVEY